MNRAFSKRFAALRATFLAGIAAAADGSIRADRANADVLFIGSSYTYYFEMPAIVAALSQASPRELRTKMIAVGGATLEDHWEPGVAQRAIHERRWDYVVLQEQSTRPLEDRHRMHDYVRRFDQEIKRNGLRPFSLRPGRGAKARSDRPISTPPMHRLRLKLA
ncbi:MAG: SGNH/GDSL hydrolase family protein [Betaproteobacteria bacterium]|nr:SGNH/GDSL hydrolase family protein [Betaproteobacteria bacterium]